MTSCAKLNCSLRTVDARAVCDRLERQRDLGMARRRSRDQAAFLAVHIILLIITAIEPTLTGGVRQFESLQALT